MSARGGALAGVTAALLGALLVAGPTSAAPSPSPLPADPENPLQVLVTELLPRAPAPGDLVEVRGVVRNTGSSAVSGIQVRLRTGERITTRGALHEADLDRPPTQSRSGTAVSPAARMLEPGGTTAFTLRTTAEELGLRELGVYPVDVEARGDAGDGVEQLGLAPTWVPYFAGQRPQPTRVAVLWPLVDRPHQGTEDQLRDDELAGSLATGGRLAQLLQAGEAAGIPQCERRLTPVEPPAAKGARPGARGPKPPAQRCEPVRVTYALDPDLLAAARTMREPYQVRADGRVQAGKGVEAARAWLTALGRVSASADVIALPFGDPDVTAMTRTADPSFREDLAVAAALGRGELNDALRKAPLQTVAWPPAGPVTPAAVDLLSRGGARAIVLDPSAYEAPTTEPARTPGARTVLSSVTGGSLHGLVADPRLSELVSGGLAAEVGPRLAEQRFLAETAVVAAQAPSLSRTLVIAPARRGAVDPVAATEALRDLGRVPWLCPVRLAEVAAASERCVGRTTPPLPPEDRGLLRQQRGQELSQSYLGQVAAERDRAVQLTEAVLSDRAVAAVAASKARLRRAVARAESSAWRDDAVAAEAALEDFGEDLSGLVGKVEVRGGQVVLTNASGRLQVSVTNRLDVPVTVRVDFRARTLGLSTGRSPLVEVPPGNAVPVSVRATAQRSGQFFVDVQLLDRDGRAFGAPSEVNLRSTRYGRQALALTAGATGVLLIAAAVRLLRRARGSRATNQPAPP